MKWNSLKNGDLLKRLIAESFSGLITSDQNIIHQQNIAHFSLKIFVIKAKNNSYKSVLSLLPKIIEAIRLETARQVFIIK